MKQKIQELLLQALARMGVTDAVPTVSTPENPAHGDYSTNVAMLLAKSLKKSPVKIAEELKNTIVKDQTTSTAGIIDRVEVAGSGFLNLYVSEASLVSQVSEVLKIQDAYGLAPNLGKIHNFQVPISNDEVKKIKQKTGEKTGKTVSKATGSTRSKKPIAEDTLVRHDNTNTIPARRVVIEYTDPNPFKELHIGHLISNVVGESLARLKEASGAVVWRADYFGDVGVHVAKSIWGIQKKMQEDKISFSDLSKKNLIERVNYMGQGYTMGTKAFDSDETAKASITALNRVLYVAAQTMWKREGKALTIDYNADGVVSTNDVDAVYELYTQGRKCSLEYFETIYKRLGTKFDGYYPESIVGEIGYQYVIDNIGTVFEKSDGAVVFRGEKFGLHTRVFINNKNLPTYEGKELGLAPAKYKDFPYDESIIVVGKEIKEYFAVLVEALKQINPKLGNVTKPIFTGMVNLPEGKMGSRFGNVITVIGLLDKLKKLVNERIQTFNYSQSQKEEIAEKVSIAAVKYAMLRVSLPSDIAFDIEASVSFEGDSGPYLQYTYARCKSVLRKASRGAKKIQTRLAARQGLALNLEERNLARQLTQFPDVVADAAKNFAPNTICTYLFHLAQEFNAFYAKDVIIGTDMRIQLTAATAQVIKNGLTLLGIETMEQM